MKSQSLTTTAALGIMAGLFIIRIEPKMGYLLIGASSLLLFMEFRAISSMRTLFRNLGLVNKDGIYPQRKWGKTEVNTLRFTIPAGLGLEDFEKNRGRMQDYMGKKLDIICEDREIKVKVLD